MATWGAPVSLKGVKGDAGLSFLSGSGAPASSLGVDTQTYFDTASGDVYYRSNGTWSKTKNLVGATGPSGINGVNGTFVTGPGAPTASQAPASGQALYISTTGEIYTYTDPSKGWVDSGENLTGPQGAQGVAGQTIRGTQIYQVSGAPSSNLNSFTPAAQPGDLAIDTSTAGGPFLYFLGS